MVKILGTGNAFTKYRNTSIMIDDILIDCGPSVYTILFKMNIIPENVLLTHGHGDHILGLPMLILKAYFSNLHMNIYAQPYVIERIKGIWENSYPEVSLDLVSFIPLKDSGIVKVNNIVFNYESRKHLHMTSLIYRIGYFVYATDVEETENDWEFYKDAKIVIHEFGNGAGHTPIETVLKIKDKANIDKLYLIHYQDDIIRLPIMNRDDVFIAKPGDVINI